MSIISFPKSQLLEFQTLLPESIQNHSKVNVIATDAITGNNKRPHCINWELTSSTRSNVNQFIIKVTADTGIHEQDLRRIFDPFFFTKEKSLGLGLSIAYKIIAEHGGNLSAKNSTDGAIFRLEF